MTTDDVLQVAGEKHWRIHEPVLPDPLRSQPWEARAAEVAPGPVHVGLTVRRVTCPLCGSADTHEIARFGSTACKALRRCNDCREPFDEFKAI